MSSNYKKGDKFYKDLIQKKNNLQQQCDEVSNKISILQNEQDDASIEINKINEVLILLYNENLDISSTWRNLKWSERILLAITMLERFSSVKQIAIEISKRISQDNVKSIIWTNIRKLIENGLIVEDNSYSTKVFGLSDWLDIDGAIKNEKKPI